jgi:hypothetical protein
VLRPALALGAAALLAACGGSEATVDEALQDRLEAKRLSVRWVQCLDSGIAERSEPVYRCTVDFGDPHLVPYCAVLFDGELVTDREQPGLRCYPPEEEQRYRDAALLGPPDD